MPAAASADIAVAPVELMLIGSPLESKAKLCGAVGTLPPPVVVQSEVSSSAMNESLTELPTYSGNSSEKNLKSNARQLLPAGTLTPIFRIVTSKSLVPRTFEPPSLAPLLPLSFGWSASVASPEVRIPNDEPAVGNPASGAFSTPFGVPAGGTASNAVPAELSWAGSAAIACASVSASAALPPTGVMTAPAPDVSPSTSTTTRPRPSLPRSLRRCR